MRAASYRRTWSDAGQDDPAATVAASADFGLDLHFRSPVAWVSYKAAHELRAALRRYTCLVRRRAR